MADPKSKTGFESVLEMFRVMDPANRERLLGEVSKRDGALAQAISEQIFRFEDLLGVEKSDLQKLLRLVPRPVLALSLRGLTEELQQQFLSNLPSAAVEEVREEWRTLGPRKVADVLEARRKVIGWGRSEGLIP
jgi:flagellar motor switch protein FliG